MSELEQHLAEKRADPEFMERVRNRVEHDNPILQRLSGQLVPPWPRFYYDAELSKQDGKPRVWFQCEHEPGQTLLDTRWTVQQIEPLTVTPSIHNTLCGCHGFITNGEWVAA